MNPEEFSPLEQIIITEAVLQDHQNPQIMVNILYKLSKEFRKNPFQQVERILRTYDTNTFLVSLPHYFHIAKTASVMLPCSLYPFERYLLVNPEGIEKTEKIFQTFQLNYAVNFELLNNTGLIVTNAKFQLPMLPDLNSGLFNN